MCSAVSVTLRNEVTKSLLSVSAPLREDISGLLCSNSSRKDAEPQRENKKKLSVSAPLRENIVPCPDFLPPGKNQPLSLLTREVSLRYNHSRTDVLL